MYNKEEIKKVIDILPHSNWRVPYTYHHDYLMKYSMLHRGMSRSEVAASTKNVNDLELYAIALTEILNEIGSDVIYYINQNDILICKKAKDITDEVLFRYNLKYDDK